MRKIAHIINPVKAGESSDLFVAQPITFETMRIAKEFAKGKVDVSLFTAQFPEDRAIIPEWFTATPDLDRSILDMGKFQEKRKLPLIKDILDRLYENTDAEYFIYSNVDIGFLPHFYVAVNEFIEAGYDAFVINRRTIRGSYRNRSEIPLMYSEIGMPHPGYDCFIYRRGTYPSYKLGNVCIGTNWVGRVLISNLFCYADNFVEFRDKHLTFHIGDERVWRKAEYSDYQEFNAGESLRVMADLERTYGPFDRSALPGTWIFDIEKSLRLSHHLHYKSSRGNLIGRFVCTLKTIFRL